MALRGPRGNVSPVIRHAVVSPTDLSTADTSYVPTSPTTEPQLLVPPRWSPGLFGPGGPRSSQEDLTDSLQAGVSAADTRYVPTPPTPEPVLVVPPRGIPGLFGPESPRSSQDGSAGPGWRPVPYHNKNFVTRAAAANT